MHLATAATGSICAVKIQKSHSIMTLYDCHLSNSSLQWVYLPYRFPRVFGDEFGDEFGDSLNFVSKLVTHLVMISVNHCIW